MTQFHRGGAKILLKQVCISILDAVPSSSLREKLCRHKINYVATMYDSLPKWFKSTLSS